MNVSTADLVSTQTAVKSIEGKYKTLQRTQQDTGELFTKKFNVFTANLGSKLDRLCHSLETSINKAMSCSTHTDLLATESVADVLHRDILISETSIQYSSPQQVHRPSVQSISHTPDSKDMNEIMDNNCNVINKYVDNLESNRNQQG